MLLVLLRVFSDGVLIMIVGKYFGCCYEWVTSWICVEQWGELIYSPKRAHLAQARIAGTRPGFCLSARPGEGLYFSATNCLAQARPPRLSESSQIFPGVLSQSRLSEGLQLEWEHSSHLSEDSQLERDLAWVIATFHFMDVICCLIGWFIDVLYKGTGYALLCMLWVGTNELVMSLAWDRIDGWLFIWNDMLMVCIETS